MMKREEGFTLVELMITMVIFLLVIASASQVLTGLVSQFKQQSKMAETNIEGAIGLEILRRDLEHAGYGLPWYLSGAAYHEAIQDTPCSTSTPWVDRDLNDGPPDNPARGTDPANTSNPPAAVRSLNNDGAAVNGSDVLTIKSVNVAVNDVSQRWTLLGVGNTKTNGLSGETFDNTDRVIILSPGNSDANRHTLVTYVDSGTTYWYTPYDTTGNFAPLNMGETNVIYGIKPQGSPAVEPRMPFNRADYYIKRPSGSSMPARCAPNTGVLYKATLNQSDGCHTEYPILYCVADMEVQYDMADTGLTYDTSNRTAKEMRENLKDVKVFILAHEGQRDPNFTYGDTTINVGDRVFDISSYRNYRWKVYTIVVKPSNMR